MSITITGIPAVKTAPRGAVWAARGAAAVWTTLSRWLAVRQPSASTNATDAAKEAALVRAMARRHAATDPGFAADLMAAADRHEGGETTR